MWQGVAGALLCTHEAEIGHAPHMHSEEWNNQAKRAAFLASLGSSKWCNTGFTKSPSQTKRTSRLRRSERAYAVPKAAMVGSPSVWKMGLCSRYLPGPPPPTKGSFPLLALGQVLGSSKQPTLRKRDPQRHRSKWASDFIGTQI